MAQTDIWFVHKGKTRDPVESGENTKVLQKQLGDMEGEVKEIQMALAAIKKDRLDLYNYKQTSGLVVPDTEQRQKFELCNTPPEGLTKFTEMVKLREELIRAKNAADEERFQREKYETKLKDWESKLNTICSTGMIAEIKETKKHSDEEITVLKSQVRDLKEETEELKISLTEKNEQFEEYRMKYLQAQQQVEEHRRQLDIIEFDNKQVSDQIQMEIQRMKMQFQEKLQELSPLPDLLKGAQIQLQEGKQLQRLAEESSQQLSDELHRVKEKLVIAVNNLNQETAENNNLNDEITLLKSALEEKNKELTETLKSLDEYKTKSMRAEERLAQQEIRFKEKADECAQLLKDIEQLRVENSRSLARSKERSGSWRRYLKSQISELEAQLIHSRAHGRACQKDRDEKLIDATKGAKLVDLF